MYTHSHSNLLCRYGDMVPVTPEGKVLATVTMVVGLFSVAMPITVLSSNFLRYSALGKKKKAVGVRDMLEHNLVSAKKRLTQTTDEAERTQLELKVSNLTGKIGNLNAYLVDEEKGRSWSHFNTTARAEDTPALVQPSSTSTVASGTLVGGVNIDRRVKVRRWRNL